MNHVFRRSLTRCLKTKKKKRKTGRKRFIHVTPVLTRIDTIYTAGIARSIQPRPGVDITFQTCNLSSFKTQNTDIRLPRSGLHYSTSPLNKALTVPRELRPLIQRVSTIGKKWRWKCELYVSRVEDVLVQWWKNVGKRFAVPAAHTCTTFSDSLAI